MESNHHEIYHLENKAGKLHRALMKINVEA
jgi:hypothetical protein